MRQRGLGLAVDRVRSKKKKVKKTKKYSPPETHHEMCSLLAAVTNSRRRETENVPRGSPYSHGSSVDLGFVEISLACINTCP